MASLYPKKVQYMLTGSPQDDIITPGTSTVAKFVAVTAFEVSHVSECQPNHAFSKRLQYVLDYLSHPMPASYCFAIL